MTCSSSGTNIRLVCDQCRRDTDTLLRYVTRERTLWLCSRCEQRARRKDEDGMVVR